MAKKPSPKTKPTKEKNAFSGPKKKLPAKKTGSMPPATGDDYES